MNKARRFTACSVIRGRTVVPGGFNNNASLNTVQAHYHVADTW